MTGLSQSAFLQALGWATLNSIWQMGLMWCCFVGTNYFFNLSAAKKYFFSVLAIFAGTLWFIVTFILFYNGYFSYQIAIKFAAIDSIHAIMPLVLSAASVTYLLLLSIPAYSLFYNWKKVQALRKEGLHKIEFSYKLFVKKIAIQLGITKNVGVYFSELVKSPITIGYLKPLILVPFASVNNLSIQQMEAVLLHELSHIKRFDYFVNILLSIVHTLFYFNPFTRLLIREVQEERENCCDQMVLQFGYDKVSYASALLSLEKSSLRAHLFVLGAAGKRNLLTRIEKIVGAEKKIGFQLNHFLGFMTALFCIFTFNVLLITPKEKSNFSLTLNNLVNPFYFFDEMGTSSKTTIAQHTKGDIKLVPQRIITTRNKPTGNDFFMPITEFASPPPPTPELINVAYTEEEQTNLSPEQTEHIKATIENTKKVLTTYQWKEVEKTIGDGLNAEEKAAVKQEYLLQLKKVNWENIEKGLKAAYEKINWQEIDGTIKSALATVKLDSLVTSCEESIRTIENIQCEINSLNNNVTNLPFPDESWESIRQQKETVQKQLEKIKLIRSKKVIKL